MEHSRSTPRRFSDREQHRQPRDGESRPARPYRQERSTYYSPMDRNWRDRRDRRRSWSPPVRDPDPTQPRGRRESRATPTTRWNPPGNHAIYEWNRRSPKRVKFLPNTIPVERAGVSLPTPGAQSDREPRAPQVTPKAPETVQATSPPTSTSSSSGDTSGDPSLESPTDVVVETLVQLLKAQHQLNGIITVTQHGILPEGYTDEVLILKNKFRPSHARPDTLRKLTESAETFLMTGHRILEEHYSSAIAEYLATLGGLPCPNLEEAWTAACSLASAALRHGLKASTISQTRAMLPASLETQRSESDWVPPVSQPVIPPDHAAAGGREVPPRKFTIAALVTEPDTPPLEESLLLYSEDAGIPQQPTERTAQATDDTATSALLEPDLWDEIWNSLTPSPDRLPAGQTPRDIPTTIEDLINSPILLDVTPPANDPPPAPLPLMSLPSTTPRRGNPRRSWALRTVHHHNNDKSTWTLTPERPVILMGDSNLKWLPYIPNDNIQVDSYPGATVSHAIDILSKIRFPSTATAKVILSFGLNSRNRGTIQSFDANLRILYELALEKFPAAGVLVPQIAFSRDLPVEVHSRIHEINDCIGKYPSIPPLPRRLFRTQHDDIHWHPRTGEAIWDLWREKLNC